jgi:hypothetical protein
MEPGHQTTLGEFLRDGDVLVLRDKKSCKGRKEIREGGDARADWFIQRVVSDTTDDEPSFRVFRVAGQIARTGSSLQVIPVYPHGHLSRAQRELLTLQYE